jgi:hypothetical protein
MEKSVEELFGSLKKGPLKDLFGTLMKDKKPEEVKDPEWPNVRIKR